MQKCIYLLNILALSFAPCLFSQGVKITTEPSKKEIAIEEDKALATGGAFGAVVFNNLTSSGLLRFNGTKVKNNLHVNGSLLTQSAHLNGVEVCGEANFKNTIIAGDLHVIGSLRTEKTTLKGHVTLSGLKATFIGSQVGSLKILKEANYKGHQVIELKQKTIVDGPLVFESGTGEVHCYPGSYVLGSVTGGKIIRKN
jgi:hypothetical protein